MEEMGFKDEVDRARARDGSGDGTDSQTTEKDLAGTAKEAAFVTGSESAPPCKTPLICCADGLDQDTFRICKELLRPFKKSLRKLHLPQHLPTEKKLKYTKESLTIIGDRIDLFLQRYCRASEVKHWQKMFWQFVSLFSEMDAKQLQKLYKYIKNNRMDKFLQLCCPSENPDSVPGLEEKKLKQLYISWGLCRGRRDLQEHPGQRDSRHPAARMTDERYSHSQCHIGTKQEKHLPAQVEPPTLGISAKGSAGEDVIIGGAGGVGQVELLSQKRHGSRKNSSKRSYYSVKQ
ncbi:CHD1 helical C-terminal domain containing protein 1 [Aptenodytes patagonicus]|uniref:CHD1 helical C-terminal domain containing protein 1 n=1 Tax=Aptenodytes patagonicus TaxID=9234 RepID=UPI003FA0BD01